MKGKKILIMGLPGSGKTTLAEKLVMMLDAVWLNADKIRTEYDDWDFSVEGRKRQSERMNKLASEAVEDGKLVIADFVCPLPENRADFNADYIIWMDTIKEGRFEDTNELFVPPRNYDLKINTKDAVRWASMFTVYIKDKL